MSSSDDRNQSDETAAHRARIVAARMRLKERFEKASAASSRSTGASESGTGPLNRHGMRKLPPGQTESHTWPILDLGVRPEITREQWGLRVDGAVRNTLTLSFADLQRYEVIRTRTDFHCVTTWSRFDVPWTGVRVADVLSAADPVAEASHILCYGHDGYTTNLAIADALEDDVLLVWEADHEPLAREHGGPVRMITPKLYAWKGSKWIRRIEVLTADKKGFWEKRGYSNTARPWDNDRYE